MRISKGDERYPSFLPALLGKKAPQNLYCLGNISLLEKAGVGFCGSRKASGKGIEATIDCAGQIARHGYNVISGYASGVDLVAHLTALECGGTTIVVLPEGINHFKIRRVVKDYWDWERLLIVSQFDPDAPWKVFRAMERNSLIVALSKLMIMIEAGESGGTVNAGLQTLEIGLPLYIAVYDDMSRRAPGNLKLLERGGRRLMKSRSRGSANLSTLFAEVAESRPLKQSKSQLILI